MPRQKRKAHQLDAEKRQCLTWNMYDAAEQQQADIPSTSSQQDSGEILPVVGAEVIIGDEVIIEETPMHVQQTVNIDDTSHTTVSKPPDTADLIEYITSSLPLPPHRISDREYKTISDAARYSIEVQDRIPPEELACRLGEIKLSLSGYRSFKDADAKIAEDVALPRFLPEGKFSLFFGASADAIFIIFDVLEGNQENVLCGFNYKAASYLCLRGTHLSADNPPQFNALEYMCRVKKGKIVRLVLEDYKRADAILTMSVCLLQGALCTPQFAAEPNSGRAKPQLENTTRLMNWMDGFPIPDMSYIKAKRQQDFNKLFDSLREAHKSWYNIQETWQHPALIPKLRPYQAQAVKWMTDKEKFEVQKAAAGDEVNSREQECKLHRLWHKIAGSGEETVYYNAQSGQFTKHKFLATPAIPGGILADEMGLGKTVEVLACILRHPRPGFSQEHLEESGVKTLTLGTEQVENDAGSGSSEGNEKQQFSRDNVTTAVTVRGEEVEGETAKNGTSDGVQLRSDTEITENSKGQNQMDSMETSESTSSLTSLHDSTLDSSEMTEKLNDIMATGESPKHLVSSQHAISASSELNDSQLKSLEHMADGVNCSLSDSSATNDENSSESKKQSCSHESLSSMEHDESGANNLTNMSQNEQSNSNRESIMETDLKNVSHSSHIETVSSIVNTIPRTELLTVDQDQMVSHQMLSGDETVADDTVASNVSVDIVSTENKSLSEEESVKDNTLKLSNTSISNSSKLDKDILNVDNDTVPRDESSPSIKDSEHVQPKKEPSSPICVSKGQFQCICGKQEVWVDSQKCVKCTKCSVWQHMMCVNFDLDRGDVMVYLCPHCCIALKPVASKATLIVSPTAICHQWVDEINRHINSASLRVLVYRGVKKHGFLQPLALANHDIVITTYGTLRQELNYVDLPHSNSDTGRRLRHAKRYMSVPSPLPAVDWWRVCLDEAQMVECPTAKVAEMALRLTAVNRWCVTGTPIQRDLDDLYGLFLFLGVEPYWVRQWWDQMLYKPYCRGNQEPMKKALAQVLWRSAKKDVLQQIEIPPQTEQVHWLKFSPVEEHFYKRKHEDCSQHFRYVVNRLHVEPDVKLNKLDKDSVKRLLAPLLRLRQACCHPQAVRGEFLPFQKNTMTMAELLKSLTTKTKTECEEAHRQLVCALNGQAAVYLIKEETIEAVNKYREVLFSAEEQKDKLKTDSLQRLHAMHNLWELLQTKPEGVPPTTRDDQLQQQMKEIRDAYMAKAEAIVANSLQSLEPIHEKMAQLNSDYDPECEWWLDGLAWARHQGYDEELVLRVKNELSSGAASDDFRNFCNRFRDVRGLQYVLNQQLDALKESRETVSSKLQELNVPIDQTTLAKCIDCHLRPFQGKKKNNCAYCELDRQLVEYEMRLFSFKERDIIDLAHTNKEDVQYGLNRPRGTWAANQTERALRVIQVFMRQVGGDELMLEYSNVHMQLLEQQKKEFKCLRAVWMALRDRVASLDELEMATMRLRLRGPDEEIDKASQPYIIEPFEMDQQWQKLLNDQAVAKHELRRKFGQLVYLQNLAKAGEGAEDGGNPEPCPICARDLGTSWTVLTCGHCFCQDCMDVLIQRHSVGGRHGAVRCAICRSFTAAKEISYVSTVANTDMGDSDIKIKGGHSTKVEAIVKSLLRIRQEDPKAKALVFSTWVDVLEIIGRALRDNDVDYRSITHPGHRLFQTSLMDFKQEEGITALLIPVHTGSHGLNIIEATHVLLVEPILNPASELQAVGRVHRIGQTRPTVVHRFLVQNTIEDRLQDLISANPASTSLDTALESDTGDLTLGDLEELFTQANYFPSSSDQD